jgi:plastocyanin
MYSLRRISSITGLILVSAAFAHAQIQSWPSSVVRLSASGNTGSNSGSGSNGGIVVRVRDNCDRATFNAALQDPTACVGDGNLTFERFLAELTEDQTVGAWKFNPDKTDARPADVFRVENRGGETHTFTKVQQFGGGFVDVLTGLSGNTNVRPECAQRLADGTLVPNNINPGINFVPAGGIKTVGPIPAGTRGEVKYQCCIHPWMRTTVNVR